MKRKYLKTLEKFYLEWALVFDLYFIVSEIPRSKPNLEKLHEQTIQDLLRHGEERTLIKVLGKG